MEAQNEVQLRNIRTSLNKQTKPSFIPGPRDWFMIGTITQQEQSVVLCDILKGTWKRGNRLEADGSHFPTEWRKPESTQRLKSTHRTKESWETASSDVCPLENCHA